MSERTREVYDRVAPWLVLAIGLMAAVGIWIGVIGVFANNRQDAQAAAEQKTRDDDTKALLKCFDDFASDLSGGLPPVRTATAAANDALSEALAQLQQGLVKVGSGKFTDGDLERIIAEFDEYQQASRELTHVRKDNPYPLPPSTFCSTR